MQQSMENGGRIMSEEIVLKGRKISGGRVEGEALVSHDGICFLAVAVDVSKGIITEKNHELEGVCFAGKILVYPTGKGSTGGSFGLYSLAKYNTAPKAIINVRVDPIAAIGAILSNIPMVDQFDQDPTQVIMTGDYLEVDADKGIVRIKGRGG